MCGKASHLNISYFIHITLVCIRISRRRPNTQEMKCWIEKEAGQRLSAFSDTETPESVTHRCVNNLCEWWIRGEEARAQERPSLCQRVELKLKERKQTACFATYPFRATFSLPPILFNAKGLIYLIKKQTIIRRVFRSFTKSSSTNINIEICLLVTHEVSGRPA